MALRPPARRRQRRTRRPDRRFPPLAVAAIAAYLILVFVVRLLLALFDIPEWTTTWQVVHALTWPLVFPLRRLDVLSAIVLANARLSDVVAAAIAVIAGLFLLASLTVRRDI